jgi:inward rectifier potassium channel
MLRRLYDSVREYQNTGFGNDLARQGRRFIRKDGTFNVVRTGMSWWKRLNPYHWLLAMPWWKFNVVMICFFLAVNLCFATCYFMLGTDHLLGVLGEDEIEIFIEVFFFSIQTFTTVGYGRINPIDLPANLIAGTESFVGVLTAAIITGLFFAKFSLPTANLIFSKNAIMYKNKQGYYQLMFRFANVLDNQLTNIKIETILALADNKKNGVWHFYNLILEQNQVHFLPLNWTVIHTITEDSPLYNLSAEDLADVDAEVLILITVFNDTFAQEVHVRHSYKFDEIIWDAQFDPMFRPAAKSSATELMLDKIDDYSRVENKN